MFPVPYIHPPLTLTSFTPHARTLFNTAKTSAIVIPRDARRLQCTRDIISHYCTRRSFVGSRAISHEFPAHTAQISFDECNSVQATIPDSISPALPPR